MKQLKSLYVSLLIIILSSFSIQSIGAETKRAWITSACYQFRLSAWDKFDGAAWNAKYVVASSKGAVFIAERNAVSDSNSSEVLFPDDFHDAQAPKISASVDCFVGETYTWEIYVNAELKDSGTIGFTRNKRK